MKNQVLENRYKLKKTIGEGSFGQVFSALDLVTKEKVAVKFETCSNHMQLSNEISAYAAMSNIQGIPKLYSHGVSNNRPYIIIDLLGKSLENKIKSQGYLFSLSCITNIGLQLMKILEDIHNSNYIHRDIKPANFVIGRKPRTSSIYLIDFGLSKKYRDPITKQHVLYGEGRHLIGNKKYASLNTRMGIEQSRRDDIEASMFMLINLLKGSLPWDILDDKTAPYAQLLYLKDLTPEQICKDCPHQFVEIVRYIRSVFFEEKPNYVFITGLLRSIASELRFVPKLDWIRERMSMVITVQDLTLLKPDKMSSSSSEEKSVIIKKKSNRKHRKDCNGRGGSVCVAAIDSSKESVSTKSVNDSGTRNAFRRQETIKNDVYPEFQNKSIILQQTKTKRESELN